jgi:hypothetical protein
MKRWLIWRYVRKAREAKPAKIPHDIKNSHRKLLGWNRPENWVTYEEAVEVALTNHTDGVGFCMLNVPGSGVPPANITAHDFDGVRDPDSELNNGLNPAVALRVGVLNSYTEITPSGCGVRVIGFGEGGPVHTTGLPVSSNPANGKFDLFRNPVDASARFITFSGDRLPGTPDVLAALDQAVDNDLELATSRQEAPHARGRTGKNAGAGAPPRAKRIESLDELDGDPHGEGWGLPLLGKALAQEVRETIAEGNYERHDGDRSDAVYMVTCRLVACTVPNPIILGVLLDERFKISEHVREQGKPEEYAWRQIENARADVCTLPIVPLLPGRSDAVTRRLEEIGMARKLELFERANHLRRPVKILVRAADESAAFGRKPEERQRWTSTVSFEGLTTASLMRLIAPRVECCRWDRRCKDFSRIDLPEKVLQMMVDGFGFWPWPVVEGIATTPLLRESGELLAVSGYDEHTRLYVALDSNLELSSIAERPTKEDAAAALKAIEDELLSEFPFENEIDKSVMLAAFMTPILRHLMPVCPWFLIRASTAGTGKSYSVDCISALNSGQWAPAVDVSQGQEEMAKRLETMRLAGTPLFSLDNLEDDTNGAALCLSVERPRINIRIMRTQEKADVDNRATIFGTGNNVLIEGDMVRRTMVCNLVAREERPETRKFRDKPLTRIVRQRGRYLGAVYTILRAFIAAGSPATIDEPLGSFEGWSYWVAQPSPGSDTLIRQPASPAATTKIRSGRRCGACSPSSGRGHHPDSRSAPSFSCGR